MPFYLAALLPNVNELLQLSLQNLLPADKSIMSVRTLVQSGCIEHNLQSLV